MIFYIEMMKTSVLVYLKRKGYMWNWLAIVKLFTLLHLRYILN